MAWNPRQCWPANAKRWWLSPKQWPRSSHWCAWEVVRQNMGKAILQLWLKWEGLVCHWRLFRPTALPGIGWRAASNCGGNDIGFINFPSALLWCEFSWRLQLARFHEARWRRYRVWRGVVWGRFEHMLPFSSGGQGRRKGGGMQERLFGNAIS